MQTVYVRCSVFNTHSICSLLSFKWGAETGLKPSSQLSQVYPVYGDAHTQFPYLSIFGEANGLHGLSCSSNIALKQ